MQARATPLLCCRALTTHRTRPRTHVQHGLRMRSAASAAPVELDGFRERVQECNLRGPQVEELRSFVPFVVQAEPAGLLRPEFAAQLCTAFPAVLERQGAAVTLSASLQTPQTRTDAVGACMRRLRDDGRIAGWRDELFPVATAFDAEPLLLLERAAAPFFGIRAYGVHVNCFTRGADGRLDLWVARRSRSKQTFPLMLDHMVAGGLGHGLSPSATVVKECREEADVPESLAARACPGGFVSYMTLVPEGVKRDVLYVYDLELPLDFVPSAADGEVEEFMHWPVEQVAETVRTTRSFKPNCNIVLVDFFVRHGIITPESRGFLALVAALRSGDVA